MSFWLGGALFLFGAYMLYTPWKNSLDARFYDLEDKVKDLESRIEDLSEPDGDITDWDDGPFDP